MQQFRILADTVPKNMALLPEAQWIRYHLELLIYLFGNHENDAAIEVTLLGTELEFKEEHIIAITGGNLKPFIDHQSAPMWKPILIKKGQVLKFNAAYSGCRAYLAIAGGVDVPEIMGSKSTYMRAMIGGYKGRQLQTGDTLAIGQLQQQHQIMKEVCHDTPWAVNYSAFLSFKKQNTIRILKGAQYELFDESGRDQLCTSSYTITTSADRMGYRLKGNPLHTTEQIEQLSEGVTFGTIQVPSNGMPIILMADRQTTGGYPKIGQVITADLPKLSQMQPHHQINFEFVTIDEAEALLIEQEKRCRS